MPKLRALSRRSQSHFSSATSTQCAQGLQLTLSADDARFEDAPSREALEQAGAVFVTLPLSLHRELRALCDARRSGALDSGGNAEFAELMRELSQTVLG